MFSERSLQCLLLVFGLGLLCVTQGCSRHTIRSHPSFKPGEKREAMLAHMSISFLLDDTSLSADEVTSVLDQAIIQGQLLARSASAINEHLMNLMRTNFGLHLRYHRAASQRVGPESTDQELSPVLNYARSPAFRFKYQKLNLKEKQAFTRVWRHPDARARQFHVGPWHPLPVFQKETHAPEAARALQTAGADYPVYLSLGIGAKCHLEKGCAAALVIKGVDDKGTEVLSGIGRATGVPAADAKNGMLTNAVIKAFSNMLSKPESIK